MSGYDLAQLGGLTEAQEKGIDVAITHPGTGEPLGITVTVAGPDSDRQRKARAVITNDRIEKRIRKATADRLDEEALTMTCAAIIGWDGVIVDGKAVEFNPCNASILLKRFPFIRDQIDAAVGDRSVFIKS